MSESAYFQSLQVFANIARYHSMSWLEQTLQTITQGRLQPFHPTLTVATYTALHPLPTEKQRIQQMSQSQTVDGDAEPLPTDTTSTAALKTPERKPAKKKKAVAASSAASEEPAEPLSPVSRAALEAENMADDEM